MVRQKEAKVIMHEIHGVQIGQRKIDGYINATAMCKAGGKKLNDYLRLKSTKEYFQVLSADTGIPVSGSDKGSGLVILTGGNFDEQDTWVHFEIAVDLGKWISPQFRVAVNRWVVQWMTGSRVEQHQSSAIAFLVSSVTRKHCPWEIHFTHDWIREAERLTGWSWSWSCMAGFINKSVYTVLPIEMQARLDQVNPPINGKRARKKFQHVNTTVDEQVVKQLIAETLGMMRGSSSQQDYWRSHGNAYSGGVQLTFILGGCNDQT